MCYQRKLSRCLEVHKLHLRTPLLQSIFCSCADCAPNLPELQAFEIMNASKIKRNRQTLGAENESKSSKYILTPSSVGVTIGSVVAVIAIAYFALKSSNIGVQDLFNANIETLKNVLAGDTPYLFFCGSRGGEKDALPPSFVELSTQLGSAFGFAVLNCSQILPSGKSIMDRFKLNPYWKPMIFGSAPWSRPMQAKPAFSKDMGSLSSFVTKYFTPKGMDVSSDKELRSLCGFNKPDFLEMSSIKNTCIVFVKGKRFTKLHTELEERLVRHMPRAKILSLDGTKKRLSIEDSASHPSDSFGLKVYALRNGTHFLPMTNSMTWDYLNTFVSYAFAQPISAYDSATSGSKLIRIVKISSAFKDRSLGQQRQQDDDEVKKARSKPVGSDRAPTGAGISEEREEIRREKERRRRASMEKEAQDFSSSNDASEGEDDDPDEHGNEDEEVIEL